METTTRNASLDDIFQMLKNQHARKADLVVPATKLRAVEADIMVTGTEPVLTPDGVTLADGRYRPTTVFDEGLAAKLGIPTGYLRRMRAERPDLYDANVNGWLRGRKAKIRTRYEQPHRLPEPEVIREAIPGDDRSFLMRTFKPDTEGETGVARALLSDKYRVIDHLDILTATLTGIERAGVNVNIVGGDLTERRMVLKVEAPEVAALAPGLLRGYRSPFTGESGDDNPTVFAGIVIANSETGNGKWTIVPRITVQVCKNGMTVNKDAVQQVHLGAKMDDGLIKWSDETQQAQLEVITLKAADAVRTFLDVDYMNHVIEEWSEAAGKPVAKVEEVKTVTKALNFNAEQIDGVMAHFVQGGQMTVGGVTNAITAYAQTVEDGDEAYDLELAATRLLA